MPRLSTFMHYTSKPLMASRTIQFQEKSITLKDSVSISSLLKEASKLSGFSEHNIELTYVDFEGDKVVLEEQSDLDTFEMLYRQGLPWVVRVLRNSASSFIEESDDSEVEFENAIFSQKNEVCVFNTDRESIFSSYKAESPRRDLNHQNENPIIEIPFVPIEDSEDQLLKTSKIEHHNVSCDSCGQLPICGARFRCLGDCSADLCSECEKKGHPHPMLRLCQPVEQNALRELLDQIKTSSEILVLTSEQAVKDKSEDIRKTTTKNKKSSKVNSTNKIT